MTLRHPFEWLSTSGQKCAFIALLALTLVVMGGLRALDGPLKTEAAPSGIVSFELAGRLPLAQSILESWGQVGQVHAGLSLGLDYLFLITYASSIALGCVLVARNLSQRVEFLSFAGVLLAWAQFGAALLDCVENYALIQILLGSQQESWPAMAWWCAVPKFLIVAAGLAYVCIGTIAVVGAKVRRRNGRAA